MGGGLLSLVLATIAFAHGEKIRTLGEPLYPFDVVAHAGQAADLASFSGAGGLFSALPAFLAACLLGAAAFATFGSSSAPMRRRAAFAIVAAAFQAALVTNAGGVLASAQGAFGITPERFAWRQLENYSENGFVAGFLTNLSAVSVERPNGYSKESAARELSKIGASPKAGVEKTGAGVRPDVVVILSESFWDPKALSGVAFDPNPTENFDVLKKTFPSGRIFSPTFGGKTALVEFEILTANAVERLPEGSIPYQQYVRSDLPSLAREFKNAGYQTVAVHPYRRKFFNRTNAYPKL